MNLLEAENAEESPSPKSKLSAVYPPAALHTHPYDAHVFLQDPRTPFSMEVTYRTGSPFAHASSTYEIFLTRHDTHRTSTSIFTSTRSSTSGTVRTDTDGKAPELMTTTRLEVTETYRGWRMEASLRRMLDARWKCYDMVWPAYLCDSIRDVASAIQRASEAAEQSGDSGGETGDTVGL